MWERRHGGDRRHGLCVTVGLLFPSTTSRDSIPSTKGVYLVLNQMWNPGRYVLDVVT